MAKYTVQDGQSWFDIAATVYGSVSGIHWLFADNNRTMSSKPVTGEILEIREDFITKDAKYFKGKSPVNNTGFLNSNNTDPLSAKILSIFPETYGGDGYAVIQVSGGKPDYSFLWEKHIGGSWIFKGVTPNLINADAADYRLTIQDVKAATVQLFITISTSNDGNFLATNPDNEILLTSGGDKIRLNINE